MSRFRPETEKIRVLLRNHNRLAQYLQKTASASWSWAWHSGQTCVEIFFTERDNSTVTIPVGTAIIA